MSFPTIVLSPTYRKQRLQQGASKRQELASWVPPQGLEWGWVAAPFFFYTVMVPFARVGDGWTGGELSISTSACNVRTFSYTFLVRQWANHPASENVFKRLHFRIPYSLVVLRVSNGTMEFQLWGLRGTATASSINLRQIVCQHLRWLLCSTPSTALLDRDSL